MPASDRCAAPAEATSDELLAVYQAGFKRKTGKGLILDPGEGCALIPGHGADCAVHVGCLGGYPASAWLRWNEGGRRVDWLADCPAGGCALFMGHPGDCDPCGIPRGDRRWHLNAR